MWRIALQERSHLRLSGPIRGYHDADELQLHLSEGLCGNTMRGGGGSRVQHQPLQKWRHLSSIGGEYPEL